MIGERRRVEAETVIIGTGIAGFAAAVFALDRGISVAQIGNAGALSYTTGYLDLFGYENGRAVGTPLDALERLRVTSPDHPLARLSSATIERALGRFVDALGEFGIAYSAPGTANVRALLPTGLSKPTASVPMTMMPGVDALESGRKTLIVDFHGLAGFSAKEFAANFRSVWPALKTARVGFPDMDSGAEVFPEVMARALEVRATRERLAALLRDIAGDAEAIGVPAIFGVHAPDRVHAAMQELVGRSLFEIPTMPPAVPGLRLRELLEQALPPRGVSLAAQHKAEHAELRADGVELRYRDNFGPVAIHAHTAILATGRFLSGGLVAERNGVRETLFDLAVSQPEERSQWHRDDYFDPRGHPVNRSGIEVDETFRPLDVNGEPASNHLFAAGAILSGQDWIRQRCGAGLAIATAWHAVEGVARALGK